LIEVRTVKHLDEMGQLLELFRICCRQDRSEEHWRWEYMENPLASADPDVIVALDGRRIVGARPFWLAELWVGNERVSAAQHCDTMVHPDYRSKGIFGQMGEFGVRYLRENGFALSYGFPGPMARAGFLKQGYRIVAQTENMFRPVRPERLLSYRLRNRVLSGGLGLLYSVLFPSGLKNTPLPRGPFEVRTCDRFSDELREIDSLRDRSAIEVVRSESYLRWRFDQHPDNEYRYLVATKEGELWGYAVISVQAEANGLVYGIIVDYLVKDKDAGCFRALAGACLNELAESEFDMMLVWAFSEPAFRAELMKEFGLRPSTGFPYSRFFAYDYFEALLTDERLAERTDIYDRANWRVTHALHDVR